MEVKALSIGVKSETISPKKFIMLLSLPACWADDTPKNSWERKETVWKTVKNWEKWHSHSANFTAFFCSEVTPQCFHFSLPDPQIKGLFSDKEKCCESTCCTSDSTRCTHVRVFKDHAGLIVTKP